MFLNCSLIHSIFLPSVRAMFPILKFSFQDVKGEAEIQGTSQEKKLKEAGDDLIHHLGEDSPAAAEVNKQVEEVNSVRQVFVNDIGNRIDKVKIRHSTRMSNITMQN